MRILALQRGIRLREVERADCGRVSSLRTDVEVDCVGVFKSVFTEAEKGIEEWH